MGIDMGIDLAFDRSSHLRRLGSEDFDLLVIGGGITGAGVALDASSRGLRVGLVERDDWASGTSSKSSKLVHGGLRYLNQRELRLVYEALHERSLLRRNAPHLVHLLPFLIPLFGKDGLINPRLAKAVNSVLWMYDAVGGWRIGKLHRRIGTQSALGHLPKLKPELLQGGFIYWDAQTDDARLALSVVQTAAQHGAVVANHCEVVSIEHDRTTVHSSVDRDELLEVRAKIVVNATGVWADRTLEHAGRPEVGTQTSSRLRPAKGVHVAVPRARLENDIAAVLPVRGTKRSVFVIPMGEHTYIGTTDTDYDGDIDSPRCTSAEVDELLDAVNSWISEPLSRSDVTGTWAGLRPLVAGDGDSPTADLSRRHQIGISSEGVITVTGGKLTTYRRMASDTVDVAIAQLGHRVGWRRRCRTKRIALWGAEGYSELLDTTLARESGIEQAIVEHLVHRYGGITDRLLAMIAEDPTLASPLVDGLPYLRAEAVHAVRHEMAYTLEDILSRRIPALWLDAQATANAASSVAELVGPLLGWDSTERDRQASTLRERVKLDRVIAGLGVTAEVDDARDEKDARNNDARSMPSAQTTNEGPPN